MVSIVLAAGATALASSAAFSGALASIGLAAGSIGASVAGSLVVGLAGAAGSIVDNAIFGPSVGSQQGPRLTSLKVSTASEGAPLPEVIGTMRIPAEVIWALSKREVASTQSGGKGAAFGGGGGSVTTFNYLGNWASALCRGRIDAIGRAWANGEIIDLNELNFRLYVGDQAQAPDPLIQAAEAVAPGFNGVAYLVFEEVSLERFGQALPQLQVEVVRNTRFQGLRGVVDQLCQDRGIEVDVSGVIEDAVITGYAVDRPMSLAAALQPLIMLFRLDVIERPGQLIIRSRDETPVGRLVEEELARSEQGGPINVSLGRKRDVPERATLQWVDPLRHYAPATSSFRRPGAEPGREVAVEMPAALNDQDARRLATGMLVDADDARTRFEFAMGPSQLAREVGDVIELGASDRPYLAQIERLTIGGSIQATARKISAKPGLVRGVSGRLPLRDVDPVPDVPVVHFMDMALLTDDEEAPHQPWVAADAATWRGVSVYRDAGQGFDQVLSLEQFAQIGSLRTPLGVGATVGLDQANTLELELRRGTLESVDPAALESAPINSLAVQNADGEWEVLQFAGASLVGERDWDLTDLRRGLRGTEHAMGAPGGSPVVVLNGALRKLPLIPEQRGLGFDYRWGPTPLPNDNPLFVQSALAFQGKGLRPYAPVSLAAARDGGGDVQITWAGRARISTDPATKPARYTVRIYSGASTVREFPATELELETYSSADQAADFGGAPADLDIGVTPADDVFGDGIEARAIITL